MTSTAIDPRLSQCGIAKLLGARGDDVLEFFMRKYTIVLGRNSKNCQVDLVLGDSMSISRKHASITYNFETRRFDLHVMGKNGVNKDGELVTPEKAPVSLNSGDRIRTGDCDFYFLLPSGGPVVAAAVQPPRNGIAAGAQEPVQQAVSPVAIIDAHTASMRDAPDLAAAAAVQTTADPVQGPRAANVRTAGPDSSSPMQVDGAAAAQPFQPLTTAAAVQPIIGQAGDQGPDQAAVMDAVAAYCASQGNGAQPGEGQPMFSKIAEALSALPPKLQDRLPPQ